MNKDKNIETTGAAQVAPARRSAPTIRSNEEILVYNGFYGTLSYRSKRNGLPLLFQNFGDSDYIPFGELQTMRATQPAFFQNNWILIEDEDVIEALGVGKYYQNSLRINEFDGVFAKTPKQITELLNKIPATQKTVLYHMACEKVKSGEIDSKKKIEALEKAFGVSFEED
jgi:hypothetical protein